MIFRSRVKNPSFLTFKQKFINIIIWILIILLILVFIMGLLYAIFNWKWLSWIKIIVLDVMTYNKLLATMSTTIGAICLAILPVLLSIDSDSLLSKLGYSDLIFVIKEIVAVLIYAAFVSALLLFPIYEYSYIVQLIYFFGSMLLVLIFSKTYFGLSIIILQCVQYRSRNLKKDKEDKKYIYSLIEKIYKQRNN